MQAGAAPEATQASKTFAASPHTQVTSPFLQACAVQDDYWACATSDTFIFCCALILGGGGGDAHAHTHARGTKRAFVCSYPPYCSVL